MSGEDAFQDMRIDERALIQALAGAEPADKSHAEIATFAREVQRAYLKPLSGEGKERQITALLEATRALANAPAKEGASRPRSHSWNLRARVASVFGAATLAFGSLAAAGALPAPLQAAASDLAERFGIDLPHPAENDGFIEPDTGVDPGSGTGAPKHGSGTDSSGSGDSTDPRQDGDGTGSGGTGGSEGTGWPGDTGGASSTGGTGGTGGSEGTGGTGGSDGTGWPGDTGGTGGSEGTGGTGGSEGTGGTGGSEGTGGTGGSDGTGWPGDTGGTGGSEDTGGTGGFGGSGE